MQSLGQDDQSAGECVRAEFQCEYGAVRRQSKQQGAVGAIR